MNLKKLLNLVPVLLGVSGLLSACAPVPPVKPDGLGVSVRAINYSGREVALGVVDPLNKNNEGGGDSLNPYGSGGTICCFSIPREWKPGIQVIVQYQFYPDLKWYEQLVTVPPYAGGRAGDIWLAMHEDGHAEAVVSNYGPDLPEWPGRIKGYPVPSREYLLKVRNDRITFQKGMLDAMEKGRKRGVQNLTDKQIGKLNDAIEDTKIIIKNLEEGKP